MRTALGKNNHVFRSVRRRFPAAALACRRHQLGMQLPVTCPCVGSGLCSYLPDVCIDPIGGQSAPRLLIYLLRPHALVARSRGTNSQI